MIFNFKTDSEALLESYDFCISGSGAAGITLALKLSKRHKVLLLEAGDENYTVESQTLYEGKTSGYWEDYPIAGTRLRFLGGTTNHWAGRCKPFIPRDFDFQPGELPGWPIAHEEVDRYLHESMQILDIPLQPGFDWDNTTGLRSSSFDPDVSLKSPPVRFGQKYRDFLASNDNVHLFTNANLIDLDTQGTSAVKTAKVVDYSGNQKNVSANQFILAMGAIENARFLLNCNHEHEKGLGNEHDMVGRCFMEHFNVQMGEFMPNTQAWEQLGSTKVELYPKDEFTDKEHIGGSNISVTNAGDQGTTYDGKLKVVKDAIRLTTLSLPS